MSWPRMMKRFAAYAVLAVLVFAVLVGIFCGFYYDGWDFLGAFVPFAVLGIFWLGVWAVQEVTGKEIW